MADGKKTTKGQILTFAAVVVVVGVLWVIKTLNPQAFVSKDAVRDDAYVHCELHARKVYDAGEVVGAQSSRYDYTFTCTAKVDVVLSDVTIAVGEVVTSRNTGVGKDEKSDRKLDSERVEETVTIKAGERFEKTGRLTRRSSIEGSRGYIELNGRLRPADAGKDWNTTGPQSFLHLKAPAA